MGDEIFTEGQKEQFDSLLQKHRETFGKEDNDLGYTEAWNMPSNSKMTYQSNFHIVVYHHIKSMKLANISRNF